MDLQCEGCKWLWAEASRLEHLRTEFLRIGDIAVAEVTEGSISDLLRNWTLHFDQNHQIHDDESSAMQDGDKSQASDLVQH